MLVPERGYALERCEEWRENDKDSFLRERIVVYVRIERLQNEKYAISEKRKHVEASLNYNGSFFIFNIPQPVCFVASTLSASSTALVTFGATSTCRWLLPLRQKIIKLMVRPNKIFLSSNRGSFRKIIITASSAVDPTRNTQHIFAVLKAVSPKGAMEECPWPKVFTTYRIFLVSCQPEKPWRRKNSASPLNW